MDCNNWFEESRYFAFDESKFTSVNYLLHTSNLICQKKSISTFYQKGVLILYIFLIRI